MFCKRGPPVAWTVGPTTLLTQELGKGAVWRLPGAAPGRQGKLGGEWRPKKQRISTAGSRARHGFPGRAWEQGLQVRQPVAMAPTSRAAGRAQTLPLWAQTPPTRWLLRLPWLRPQMQHSSCKANHAHACSCGWLAVKPKPAASPSDWRSQGHSWCPRCARRLGKHVNPHKMGISKERKNGERKNKSHKYPVFTAARFIIARKWKQLKCP